MSRLITRKHEYQITMRDGVKLFTAIYAPRDQSQRYPILFKRTPYSIAPYGADRYHPAKDLAPADAFLRDGYILVLRTCEVDTSPKGSGITIVCSARASRASTRPPISTTPSSGC